jgi:hypothetical protein
MSFSDYVQKQTLAPVELPLVHTTEYFRLASIKASHMLRTGHCGVFKEPLVYFFYGRPAYRDSSQTIPTRDVGFYPICFVFQTAVVCKKAKRMYPFDSGASQIGLYEPEVSRAKALANYQVLALVENARRITSAFFESDEQYLSNRPKSGLVFSPDDTDAESYYGLINGGGAPECDDRCSAVEIQVEEDVDVRHGIMAIVLPTCFLEDKSLTDTLINVWRAVPLTYDADLGMRPLEFHSAVRQLIRKFYRDSRLI